MIGNGNRGNGLVWGILWSAEIASLGKSPHSSLLKKVADVAEARQWFMAMDTREPGWYDIVEDSIAGFGAGYCLSYLDGSKVNGKEFDAYDYLSNLYQKWQESDKLILGMISRCRKKYDNRMKIRKWDGRGRMPDPNTHKTCDHTEQVLRRCKEMYNG